MIWDSISNYKNYKLIDENNWQLVFDFIQSVSATTEEKKYYLSDRIYALVMSYNTISHNEAKLESHVKYIDVQVSILGAEAIECFPVSQLSIKMNYYNEKDVIFYNYPGSPHVSICNFPGYFTLLTPSDAHMPQLKVANDESVKKLVVKIPVDLLL